MKTYLIKAMMCLPLFGVLLVACGDTSPESPCKKTTDCAGNETCVNGKCTTGGTGADLLEGIGLACDGNNPCPTGLACGSCGIVTGQCVIACSTSGIGAAAGCPDGAFCSGAWQGTATPTTTTHYCVRMCGRDDDCQAPTGNQGLSCNGSYNDDGSDTPSVCSVSNSIGSTHLCQ